MPRASSSRAEARDSRQFILAECRDPSGRLQAGPKARLRGAAAVVLVAVLAGCGLLPRASMAEVLDGQATSEARSAAIGRVEQWPQGFSVSGVSEVARQTYTTCVEGQNSLWVHDGYRLKCAAHSLVYFGWDGDYGKGLHATLDGMARVCVVTERPTMDDVPPSGPVPTLGPNYSCSPDMRGVAQSLSGGEAAFAVTSESWGVTFDDRRVVAGPQDDALLKRLRTRRWLFAVDVSSVFFQDAP